MIDKVQKIHEEVERLMNELIQEKEKGFGSDTDDACILELQNVLTYIDSLQEEHVSEDLEDAADNALSNVLNTHEIVNVGSCLEMFRFGAQWQKEQMMKDATDVTVHIDASDCPYIPQMELYDYDKDVPLAKDGEKVKVIVIKEN